MSLIEQGLEAGHIVISDDGKQITYVHQNKKRNYTNPEEKVQAETFLKLIMEYGYPAENIELYKTVTMGSDKKEADIIVYENAEWAKPIIVVECKKEDVSQQEFNQAVNQAFSYASAIAGTVKYIWVTSIILNSYFRFDKETEERASLQNIPLFGSDKVAPYRYVKGGGRHKYLGNYIPVGTR